MICHQAEFPLQRDAMAFDVRPHQTDSAQVALCKLTLCTQDDSGQDGDYRVRRYESSQNKVHRPLCAFRDRYRRLAAILPTSVCDQRYLAR